MLAHSKLDSREVDQPDQATRHQDGFRRVVLGQVSDALFPPPSGSLGIPEEEFARQARADAGPRMRNRHHLPALGRWLLLLILASVVLSVVLR